MTPLASGLLRHDGRIARIGRRIGEFERPVCGCLEIVHGHEPAGVLLQHEEARMSIGKVKFAAGLQHGCDYSRPNRNIRQPADRSPELLLRAVAYRMQEVALGGLRPERPRQLRQFAQQLNGSQEVRIRPRPELKPGTRLVREWQGRTYDVRVLDDGFSWQGTSYRSLSAIARQITGTACSGPLFFGLKANRTAALRPSRGPRSAGEDGDAAS